MACNCPASKGHNKRASIYGQVKTDEDLAHETRTLARRLLEALQITRAEFCSMRCPSTGRAGIPIPHTDDCIRISQLIAEAERTI